MPRVIVLDTFPLSNTGKRLPDSETPLTLGERCHLWVSAHIAAGNHVVAPAICYYEVMREMERIGATSQIKRIRNFCFGTPGRFISIADAHLETAAQLWAQARNLGTPTASADSLDGDVILAAQALSLGLPPTEFVVATTNPGHLSRFVPADLWSNIPV